MSFGLALLLSVITPMGRQLSFLTFLVCLNLLDRFVYDAKVTKMYVNEYQPGTELWLGETSNTYGGGTPVLSGVYVAGFM